MKVAPVEYGKTFFRSSELKRCANDYLEKLDPSINIIVSSGSSGCAIASAMTVVSTRDLFHVHFRKEGESHHGTRIPGLLNLKVGGLSIYENFWVNKNIEYHFDVAIVDDLVDYGKTILKISKEGKELNFNIKQILVGFKMRYLGAEMENKITCVYKNRIDK